MKCKIGRRTVTYKRRSFDSGSEKHVHKELSSLLNRKSTSSIWTQISIPENGHRRFDVGTLYGCYKSQRTLVIIEYDGPHHFVYKGFKDVQRVDNEKAENLLLNYPSFLIRLECKNKHISEHLAKAFAIINSLRKRTNRDISTLPCRDRIYFSDPSKYKWHIGCDGY